MNEQQTKAVFWALKTGLKQVKNKKWKKNKQLMIVIICYQSILIKRCLIMRFLNLKNQFL